MSLTFIIGFYCCSVLNHDVLNLSEFVLKFLKLTVSSITNSSKNSTASAYGIYRKVPKSYDVMLISILQSLSLDNLLSNSRNTGAVSNASLLKGEVSHAKQLKLHYVTSVSILARLLFIKQWVISSHWICLFSDIINLNMFSP